LGRAQRLGVGQARGPLILTFFSRMIYLLLIWTIFCSFELFFLVKFFLLIWNIFFCSFELFFLVKFFLLDNWTILFLLISFNYFFGSFQLFFGAFELFLAHFGPFLLIVQMSKKNCSNAHRMLSFELNNTYFQERAWPPWLRLWA